MQFSSDFPRPILAICHIGTLVAYRVMLFPIHTVHPVMIIHQALTNYALFCLLFLLKKSAYYSSLVYQFKNVTFILKRQLLFYSWLALQKVKYNPLYEFCLREKAFSKALDLSIVTRCLYCSTRLKLCQFSALLFLIMRAIVPPYYSKNYANIICQALSSTVHFVQAKS